MLWCLNLPSHAPTVLALDAAIRVARVVAGWVPARIGADETGAVAAFAALELSSASGLALALARRTRDILICILGLGWLACEARSAKGYSHCDQSETARDSLAVVKSILPAD